MFVSYEKRKQLRSQENYYVQSEYLVEKNIYLWISYTNTFGVFSEHVLNEAEIKKSMFPPKNLHLKKKRFVHWVK